MNKEERKAYWKQEIAFDCPRTNGKRCTIEFCFNHCEFSGRVYHDGAAYLNCLVDCQGERELHNGAITRDN